MFVIKSVCVLEYITLLRLMAYERDIDIHSIHVLTE